MGFYSGYEPPLANLSQFAINRYNLTFYSFANQHSYNSRLFKTGYLMLQFAVNMFIGVGDNDLTPTQIFTGLGYQHYFAKRNLETPYERSTVLNKNKITRVND